MNMSLRVVRVFHEVDLAEPPGGVRRGDILRTRPDGGSYRNEDLHLWDGRRAVRPWNTGVDVSTPDDYGHVPRGFDPFREGIALWGPETWWIGPGSRVRHNQIFYADLSSYREELIRTTLPIGRNMLLGCFVDPLQGKVWVMFYSIGTHREISDRFRQNIQTLHIYCLDAEGLPGYDTLRPYINPASQTIFMPEFPYERGELH